MIGKLKDLMHGRDGEWVISFTTPTDFSQAFDELAGKEVSIEIRRNRKKRSLDANAYCWALIGKIAEKMGLPKDEVYRKEIIEHGAYKVHCLQDEDVEEQCADWCSFGLGFQVETFPSKLEGCTNVIFYKGSSYYNTQQMAKLIDGIIHEAESLGIPTITDSEAEKLIGKWAVRRKKEGKDDDPEGTDS